MRTKFAFHKLLNSEGWRIAKTVIHVSVFCGILSGSAVLPVNEFRVVTPGTVNVGETGVQIPILITNDVELDGIVLPLVIRANGGASITSATLGYGDRLTDALDAFVFCNQYADRDGNCSNEQGGFGTVAVQGCDIAHPVESMPEGFLFNRQALFDNFLQPGSDVTGSMILMLDFGPYSGTIEIDTTCVDPENHLLMHRRGQPPLPPITPEFQKGIINVVGSNTGEGCHDPHYINIIRDHLTTVHMYSTCGLVDRHTESCLDMYDNGEDMFYELFVGGDPIMANIILDPMATEFTGLVLDDVCPPGLDCLAFSTNDAAGPHYITNVPLESYQTYYLMLDNWPGEPCISEYKLMITSSNGISSGGACSNQIPLALPGSLPYVHEYSTCGQVHRHTQSCLDMYDNGEDVFYELIVTEPVTIDICLDPHGTRQTALALDDSCPPDVECLASSTNDAGTPHYISRLDLDPGTYSLMVDNWPDEHHCIPTYTLSIHHSFANDQCEAATVISEVEDMPFTTGPSTFAGPGLCMTSPNIWYQYTTSCDGLVMISLCGSSYDTKVAVFGGTSCDPIGDLIDCDDDGCGSGWSELTFPATEGSTYLIEVGGYENSAGDGLLSVTCGEGSTCCIGEQRGDANLSGGSPDLPTIGDISAMIDAKFISSTCGPKPGETEDIIACLDEADVNASAVSETTCDDITIGDISLLIDYLFITGPAGWDASKGAEFNGNFPTGEGKLRSCP